MKYSTLLILTGLSLIVFNSCSPTSSGSGSSSSLWTHAIQKNYNGHSAASMSDLNQLSIPVLKSDSLAAKWGAPKVEKSASGYRLSYADPKQPFRRVVIYGMSNLLPALSAAPTYSGEDLVNGELTGITRAQSWRSPVSIAGKSVRWFMESASGGADGAYYSTEGASVEQQINGWLEGISF